MDRSLQTVHGDLSGELSVYELSIKKAGVEAIWLIGEQLKAARDKVIELTGNGKAPGFTEWVEEKFTWKPATARRYIRAYEDKNQDIKQIWGHETKRSLAIVSPDRSDACTISDLQTLVENEQRFATIYADPPWQYSNQATRSSTDKNYPTMTVDEICQLPVSQISEDDAHLHLWTTNAFLPESFRVIESWGIEYKSCFVLVKPQMGIGNYWRVSHEFLLLGVRGNCPFADHSLKSWASLDRGEHSAKPGQVRAWIERCSPGPYIELFARQVFDGWAAWGNEIDRAKSGLFHAEVAEV